MAKKITEEQETNIEKLESALTQTEQYIEKNQKAIIGIVLAIVLIVGGYLGYTRLYIAPMEKEAHNQSFAAERFFQDDQFELALDGDGNYLGFLDIISSYGPTKTANLAHYYAGISYRQLGDYEQAVYHLNKFSTRERVVSAVAYGALGDCYVELGDLDNGIKNYLRAAKRSKNDFVSPIYLMKAGLVYEELGKMAEAVKVYETIKSDYPKSTEARDIEKWITRAKLNM